MQVGVATLMLVRGQSRVLIFLLVTLAVCAAVFFSLFGASEATLRSAVRWTARLAFAVYVAALAAPAIRLRPREPDLRRALIAAFLVHLAAIAALFRAVPPYPGERLILFGGGGIAYALVALLGLVPQLPRWVVAVAYAYPGAIFTVGWLGRTARLSPLYAVPLVILGGAAYARIAWVRRVAKATAATSGSAATPGPGPAR